MLNALWKPTTVGAMSLPHRLVMAPMTPLALANPDLVERLRAGVKLNDPDPATFYGGERQATPTTPPTPDEETDS